MYETPTIVVNDPGVCQFVTRTGYAKMAERIDVLFQVDPRGRRGWVDAAFVNLLWPLDTAANVWSNVLPEFDEDKNHGLH